MRFLLESPAVLNGNEVQDNSEDKEQDNIENIEEDSFSNLEKAKKDAEQKIGKDYDSLNTIQRKIFISKVLESMDNYKRILSKAKNAITDCILDSNWQNKDFNNYISNLNNEKIFNDQITQLVYNLFKNGSLDYNRDTWLKDQQVYNRLPEDVLYTIKALTFASDPKLQEKDGKNRYFDKPLKVSDLYEDDKLPTAARLRDKINEKQTKGFGVGVGNTESNGSDIFKEIIKSQKYNLNDIIKYIVNNEYIMGDDINDFAVKSSIDDYLRSNDGKRVLNKALMKEYSTDNNVLDTNYTLKDALNDGLKDLLSKFLSNSSKDNKELRQTGYEILKNNNITQDTLKDFVIKTVYPNKDQEMQRRIFDNYLDTADGRNKLRKILSASYNDTIVSNALDELKDSLETLAQNIQVRSKG